MGITPRKRDELEAMLPPALTTQNRLLAWKSTTGLSWEQIGTLSGRSRVGMERFAKGQYHHTADTDVLIRQSVEEFLERFPVVAPQPEKLGQAYETESLAMVREWFYACQAQGWIAVLYGPPGSGKSFSLKVVHAEFMRTALQRETQDRAFYLRATHNMGPLDILQRLCRLTGAPASNRIQHCLTSLRMWLSAYKVLFAFDEMQGVPLDTFEVIRELHDEQPHAGMLIAGSHKLADFLKRHAGELEQWNRRIDTIQALPEISRKTAEQIVRGEMPQAGPQSIEALVKSSIVPDIRRGGLKYTSLGRLSDNITKRKLRLAQQEASEVNA